MLLWSGGIDSTAVVVAFLEATRADPAARARLLVRLAPRSIDENPRFFARAIAPALRHEMLDGHVRDAFPPGARVVTGDPADMLLGTFKIAAAFRAPGPANPLWMAMDAPWRETMPKALHARGLLLNPGERPTSASVDAASARVGRVDHAAHRRRRRSPSRRSSTGTGG